jgi:uncharacterized protein
MNAGLLLYRLQQTELDIQKRKQSLAEIENSLHDDSALVEARKALAAGEQSLAAAMKKQKELEYEIENLQNKKKQINYKLYSGSVKNPKELSNLESELASVESRKEKGEDELLEVMARVEELEGEVHTSNEKLEFLQRDWGEKQLSLGHSKGEVEAEIRELEGAWHNEVASIDPEALDLYNRLKSACGWAVARVEGGKCEGCHIALPTGQWQKARSGEIVQCNNCGRILYLE